MQIRIGAVSSTTPSTPPVRAIARRASKLLLLLAANAALVAVAAAFLYLSCPAPRTAQAASPARPSRFPNEAARRVVQPTQPVSWSDRYGDGTPDFLRLDSPADRESFRRWFALVAEYQAFRQPAEVPGEISDCAALLRYSYRNALRSHDSAWTRETAITPPADPGTIGQYRYPFTPLGAALFRVQPGPAAQSDVRSGAFAEFADAKTLKSLNTHFISRDLARRAHRRSAFLPPARNGRAVSLDDLRGPKFLDAGADFRLARGDCGLSHRPDRQRAGRDSARDGGRAAQSPIAALAAGCRKFEFPRRLSLEHFEGGRLTCCAAGYRFYSPFRCYAPYPPPDAAPKLTSRSPRRTHFFRAIKSAFDFHRAA